MKRKYVYYVKIASDCGKWDEGRYEDSVLRNFYPCDVRFIFFATESMSTLQCGYIGATHALSMADSSGPLQKGEKIGAIFNAATREGQENGRALRGEGRKPEGEEIYALRLKSGVWVVGPNAGYNFFFLRSHIAESYLVVDTSSGSRTIFRSEKVMVPVLAKVLGARENPHLLIESKELPIVPVEQGVFVAGWDSHGNIYLALTQPDHSWIPALGENRAFHIGANIARLRHVDGLFAGNNDELILTAGSLKQINGQPVYYIAVVGGNAHSSLGNPPVGTRVEIEEWS